MEAACRVARAHNRKVMTFARENVPCVCMRELCACATKWRWPAWGTAATLQLSATHMWPIVPSVPRSLVYTHQPEVGRSIENGPTSQRDQMPQIHTSMHPPIDAYGWPEPPQLGLLIHSSPIHSSPIHSSEISEPATSLCDLPHLATVLLVPWPMLAVCGACSDTCATPKVPLK